MDEILQAIKNTMSNSSLTESFFKAVLQRLISLGYKLEENDDWILCFAIQGVENHIKSSCNVTSIPDELFNVAVDRVCGEFLFTKKQTGQLVIDGLDLTGAIASISEGDTSVSFVAGATDDDRFNLLVNYLMTKGDGDFVCYRRLKW
jgi:hypothetical protein